MTECEATELLADDDRLAFTHLSLQAVDAIDRSQPAVNQAIRQLWDDDISRETTGKQRNRRFEAPAVFEIIELYNP